MKKIMFNDKYGLTAAVLNCQKTMTRRIVKNVNLLQWLNELADVGGIRTIKGTILSEENSAYKVDEIVAVAQKYLDLCKCDAFYEALSKADPSFPLECIEAEKGAYNKMFVKAEWMPHHIRITNIKVERLQDISHSDCLREGIEEDFADGSLLYWWSVPHEGISWEEYKKRNYELSRHELNGKPGSYFWDTPQGAFAALIDKVSGNGTWERNPWVFVYTFELID